MQTWIQLQNDPSVLSATFALADMHALTSDSLETIRYGPCGLTPIAVVVVVVADCARVASPVPKYCRDIAAHALSFGLDPSKVVIFKQSAVAEHTELLWILATVAKMGQLLRMTQYKVRSTFVDCS